MVNHSSPSVISTKNITIAGLVALASLLATLGFTSPREQVAEVKKAVSEVRVEVGVERKRVDAHDIQFAETRRDIGYIMDGIDDLRGLDKEERKAKRRRRRGEAE